MKNVKIVAAWIAVGCWGAACSTSSTPAGSGTGGVTGTGGSVASGGTVGGTGGATTATSGPRATGGATTATGGQVASATGGAATAGAGTGGRATGGQTGFSTGGRATGGSAGGQAGQSGAAATGGRMTGGTTGRGGSTGTSADGSAADLGLGIDGTAGVCSTSTGAAFAPLTDYTARDGGFGPAVTTRNTGDGELGTASDGTANKVAIFRPAAAKYGQGGVMHPIIVWGNGSTNTVDIWQGFLARVATYGFVVVAPEQSQVTADHMNKAIDYVLRLATDPTSGDCGKIDTTKIGSTGYSRGGGGAISVGNNQRITSTFIFASNGNVNNLKAPWGVIGGDADTIFNWTAINSDVTGSAQPAFGAALAGVDHNRVAGNAKAQEGYVAWMRWRFMGDVAGHDMFVGASCKLCTDTAFSGVVKTTTFDGL